MTVTSLLGLLGTLIGLIRALPQLFRILRAKGANGVSADAAATSAIVSFGWAFYGVLTRQPYVTLATGSSGAVFLLIFVFALRYGRSIKELKVAPLWFSVLAAAAFLAGSDGLGVVLPVSVLAANLPQLRVAYTETDLTHLSLGTWLLSISDGLVWGIYALIQHDMSIIVFAIFQLTTSGLIVSLKMAHNHKIRLTGAANVGACEACDVCRAEIKQRRNR